MKYTLKYGGIGMKKRVITGILMALILAPLVFVDILLPILELFAVLFVIIAVVEMINMYEKVHHTPIGVKIIVVFSTLLLYLSLVSSSPFCIDSQLVKLLDKINFKIDLILTLGLVFVLNLSCLVFVPDFDAADIGRCFLAIIYVALGFGAFMTLRFMGIRFVVYLIIVVMGTDIFALVFGLSFGKHKMAPLISPKKSWEGAIGGSASALILGVMFVLLYQNISNILPGVDVKNFFEGILDLEAFHPVVFVGFIILLTLSMSISGQIGDLVASKLKRSFGIKDYSNIFPGHGGVLDRFDSLIYSSVIFLFFLTMAYNILPYIEIMPL
jgi:phosphatidate cytidylyltransferase